ncbi:acetate--CoA ligase family protein [Metallumcola ferriviriculae]|uniref:Acetate--CoA ligase family protein n=1 Tax=Metallumcola ferriviriculae TaxID=3039180 RepID=A0AAU0UTS8_9FIRM|nr:acetate--CoA ligase family protein [Desulfitibacteraceae bacterium MK1]
MKLLEYEAKSIFLRQTIPVPKFNFFQRDELAEGIEYLKELGGKAVLKTQVLTGGRGKAGGIKFVDKSNIREIWNELKGLEINGESNQGFLLEEPLDIKKELYLGITIDLDSRMPLFIASAAGGMDVEEHFKGETDQVCRRNLLPSEEFRIYHALDMGIAMGLEGKELTQAAALMLRLYQVFQDYDCELVEINPLVITTEGQIFAADAKMVINDDALFRQQGVLQSIVQVGSKGTPLEEEAKQNDIHFVELGGNVAALSIGAGLNMTLLDMIKLSGGEPANFIDTKGGAKPETIEKMTEIVLKKIEQDPKIRCMLITISLSATQLKSLVNGIVRGIEKRGCSVPILAVIHATDASLREMDLDTAEIEFAEVGIKNFPQLKEMFAYCSQLLKTE